MAVGAAEAERVDPGAGARGDLFSGRRDQPQVERVERISGRRLAVQRRRHDAVLERQHRLDQPGDAGGGFQMADIGLYRTDRQRLGAALAEARPTAAASIGSPAGCRCRASRSRRDVGRRPRRARKRCEQRRLRRLARQRQPDRAAVGVDAGAEDHGADPVAVGQRLRQRLEHHHAAAFAADIAVGALVEGVAAAAARQHRGAAKAEKRVGREQQVDAADDRGLDAAVAMASQAWCSATSDDEQAVSIVRLGPCRSKT